MTRAQKKSGEPIVYPVIVDKETFEQYKAGAKRLIMINAERIEKDSYISIQNETRSFNQKIYDFIPVPENNFVVLLGVK
jgi:hypothetical protein